MEQLLPGVFTSTFESLIKVSLAQGHYTAVVNFAVLWFKASYEVWFPIEPRHEESCFLHMQNFRYTDNKYNPLLSKFEISSLLILLSSAAVQKPVA